MVYTSKNKFIFAIILMDGLGEKLDFRKGTS